MRITAKFLALSYELLSLYMSWKSFDAFSIIELNVSNFLTAKDMKFSVTDFLVNVNESGDISCV